MWILQMRWTEVFYGVRQSFIYGEFLAPLETTEPTFKLVPNSKNTDLFKDKHFRNTKKALIHNIQTFKNLLKL